MKIIVCVKQVADTVVPIRLDIVTNMLPGDLNYITNPADISATEEAVKLKEKVGGEVILMSAGPPRVSKALRYCLAIGADRAVRVWHPMLEECDAYVVAQVLAWAIAPTKPDLVFCGNQSLDEGSGQVPPTLAEILNLPQITNVTFLEISESRQNILTHRKLDKGQRQIVESNLPAVISVDSSINSPRFPKFSARYRARKASIEVFDCLEMGMKQPDCPVRFAGLSAPRPRPKKTFDVESDLSPEERLKQLMSGGVKEKSSALWEGSPEDLAARLAKVLVQRGFFRPKEDLQDHKKEN